MSGNSPEVVRRRFLKRETHFKQMGGLNFFVGLITLLAGSALLFSPQKLDALPNVPFGSLLILLSVIYIVIGRMLQKLDPRVRVPMTVIAIIELIGFPMGTIKGLYFLYLFHSPEGKYVFSPEYKSIIAMTPHVKNRTSKGALILLLVLIIVMVFILIMASFSK